MTSFRLTNSCISVLFYLIISINSAYSNDQSIDFSEQEKQKTAERALNNVKVLSKEIQGLKKSVVDLNKDLQLMEEELLFPSSTQLSIFVSLDIGQFFTLESVKVKINGKQVASHLYSEKQRQALARGGVQRLYLTNLNLGKHKIVAFFTGIGPNGRPYKRASELEFQKSKGSQFLELAIVDDSAKQEAQFTIKQW
ncbi:MAG: AraC family transcriptional regulator [Oleispira sp.]